MKRVYSTDKALENVLNLALEASAERPQTEAEMLAQMKDESAWPMGDILPLKHATRHDQDPLLGAVGLPLLGTLHRGKGPVVVLGDMFGIRKLGEEVYPDFEAVLAAGWVVD
jgi:hypothetical protein